MYTCNDFCNQIFTFSLMRKSGHFFTCCKTSLLASGKKNTPLCATSFKLVIICHLVPCSRKHKRSGKHDIIKKAANVYLPACLTQNDGRMHGRIVAIVLIALKSYEISLRQPQNPSVLLPSVSRTDMQCLMHHKYYDSVTCL